MLKLYDLTTEYKREPLGLDEAQPRFGWTNYRKRLQYQTCAVTLHSGKNHLALTLVNGWYKGKLGFMPQPARLFDYGFDTLIFQLPGRFLVDNFCRADGGEHRCGRSVSTAPEAAYLLPGLGANGIVGGLQVVEPVLHQPLAAKVLNRRLTMYPARRAPGACRSGWPGCRSGSASGRFRRGSKAPPAGICAATRRRRPPAGR